MRIINNRIDKTLSTESQQALIQAAINMEMPGDEIHIAVSSQTDEGNIWSVMDENGLEYFKFDDQDNIAF